MVPLATSVCSEKRKSGWQDLFLTDVTNPDEWEYLHYQFPLKLFLLESPRGVH